ncbi:MAG: thioesterase family protein [Terriglobia bacterium]
MVPLDSPSPAQNPAHHWIDTEVRVRYAETDQMGIAYYSNYLVWFEVGRGEYCRQRGFVYRDFEKENEAHLAVAEAQCRYHSPARYDDLLVIRTRVPEFRKRTVRFEYEILKKEDNTLVATGWTLHVILDKNGKMKSFPQEYVRFLKAEEISEP